MGKLNTHQNRYNRCSSKLQDCQCACWCIMHVLLIFFVDLNFLYLLPYLLIIDLNSFEKPLFASLSVAGSNSSCHRVLTYLRFCSPPLSCLLFIFPLGGGEGTDIFTEWLRGDEGAIRVANVSHLVSILTLLAQSFTFFAKFCQFSSIQLLQFGKLWRLKLEMYLTLSQYWPCLPRVLPTLPSFANLAAYSTETWELRKL